MRIKRFIICTALAFVYTLGKSQSLPVGTVALEDYFRRAQLLGIADSSVSFTVRPVFPAAINNGSEVFYPDKSEQKYNLLKADATFQSEDGKIKGAFLPFGIQTQINSDHPYGWNDGAMIPAKGFQTVLTGGIYAKYGLLSIQFKPEIVIAQNPEFETFDQRHYDVIFARYYDIYNNIDLPVRFGTSNYVQAFWGQSSIRLNYKGISFGLSTENLWWGPGTRNSLLMSNSAPGFKHLTLNTSKPLKTAIGSFEGQLIAGRLENSGFAPLVPDHTFFGNNLYVPKRDDWRYLAGIVVTWQPKWVPGLFLGFDQSSQTYGHDLSRLGDYLPIFSPIKKVSAPNDALNKQDQRNAVFMRWLWTKEQAEIYFEYGHSNTTNDFLQSLLSPENSRAYIWGLRKMLPFNTARHENILVSIEATQLQENSISKILAGEEWYVSKNIRQGYTNRGESLGAGIGPGGNLQSLEVSWVRGLKRVGFQLERYVHNNDFYYYAFSDSQDYTRHWVDLSMAFSGEWNYKNLIFNTKFQGIRSFDYQWALTRPGNDLTFQNQTSKFNVQFQAGATYRF
jgi:hypothetical protein